MQYKSNIGNLKVDEMKKLQAHEMPVLKKIFFSAVAIVLPFLFLFMLEIILRLSHYGQNMHLFIDHPNKNFSDYKAVNPFIGEKYFRKFDATGGTNDIFLKKKPKNGYRIFLLGSSTVVGFPYNYNLMFSRILQKRLQDAYPEKHIEVINTAITAINSITLLDFMREIVHFKPDAVLIYEGHNEFYGAFGIGSQETLSRNRMILKLHFRMLNLKIYQLFRNTIYSVINSFSKVDSSSEKSTLMKRMVADSKIAYKSEKYNTGISQFTKNFSQILWIAQKHNIPVFISEQVSNIKDQKPFGSAENENYPAADEVYMQANQSDKVQDYQKAKQLYYYAKDLDCVRFRASEEINDTIHKIAARYKAYLVPMKTYFEKESANGQIGNDLMTEHLHPNIKGQFLMASAFFDQIINSKLISDKTDTFNYKSAAYYKRNWGYTELDSLAGLHKVNRLKSEWPFVAATQEFNYRLLYHPKGTIDSMAFSTILNRDVTVESLHRKLGEKYSSAGDYYSAYREHNALVCINPYWPDYYIQAGNSLLHLNDLHMASAYFKKSIELKTQNYFPYFALGEISIIRHDFRGAVRFYETALKLSDNVKDQLIVVPKLYIAYVYNGQSENSKALFNRIKKMNPSAKPEIPKMPPSYSEFVPYFVKNEITEAENLMMNKRDDDALVILKKSIEIWDTPLANKYIGDILFKRRDNSLLYYYVKAYPEFKYDPVFLGYLFRAYLVNQQTGNASRIISELKALDPNNLEIPKLEKFLKSIRN